MSCISPVIVSVRQRFIYYTAKRNIQIECGRCLNCLIKKQSALEFLAKKELLEVYKSGRGASFVTLTYDDNHIPYTDDGLVTLRRSDVQKFIKNMRRQMEYYGISTPFKYIYCGELGDETARPHYHIVFLGLTDNEVRIYTRKLWKHGLCDIGVLSAGGIRYVLKYMTKAKPSKDVKELRDSLGVQNPFVYHSVGLGRQWINDNIDKIVNDRFTFNLNGKINLLPKYVCQYVSAKSGVDYHPYVIDFLCKEINPVAKAKGLSFSQYDWENSYIHYKNLVYSLRSRNKPVDDITLKKSWAKPFHSYDRVPKKIDDLTDLAIYGDVVPF